MMSKSAKRYMRDFSISMTGYVLALLASELVYQRLPESPARPLMLLIPIVPILFAFAAFIRYVRELDELQQRIQMEAFAFSLGLTGILTFTYGLLESAGLPKIGLIWVFPLTIMLWGIGQMFAKRRYE
jgi:hypothetical protein